MTNSWCRVLGAILVSVAASSQASDAAALAPDSKEGTDVTSSAASDLIERGIALRRAGDDARALELFKQAEQAEPQSTRVQVHLAATHQALGNWESADRYLSLAIRNPEDPYVQKHQAVLAAARRTIDAHIGSLQLSGGPEGAEIKLNGRVLGTLPIEQTVRLEAGIYTLEARLPGYYPVTRSVALAGGVLVRESIQLTQTTSEQPAPSAEERHRAVASPGGGANWLTWTFGGLAVGAGAATVVAWATREKHVDNWNDDSQCLRPGETRGEVCAAEHRYGDRAENWMWVAGAATGAFAMASVVSLWINSDDTEHPETALGCGVGLGLISCSGRF